MRLVKSVNSVGKSEGASSIAADAAALTSFYHIESSIVLYTVQPLPIL